MKRYIKLLLISLVVRTSISSCGATANNNLEQKSVDPTYNNDNDRQGGIDPTMMYLIKSLNEANERVLRNTELYSERILLEQKESSKAKIQIVEGEKENLKMKYQNKKLKRSRRRAKQRQRYIVNKLDSQRVGYKEYLKAEAEQKKEADSKEESARILGACSVVAGLGALTLATGGIATVVCVGLAGVTVVAGIDAKNTRDKKIPCNEKTPEELLLKAKELYPSSESGSESI